MSKRAQGRETTGPVAEDPRIERSKNAISASVLSEFAERGYDGLTIEGVALRAGVAKSTIYRYWSNREDLITDALLQIPSPAVALDVAALGSAALGSAALGSAALDRGDFEVREVVLGFLVDLSDLLHTSEWSRVMPALVQSASRSDELAAVHRRVGTERRQALVDLLRVGVEAGQLSSELDLDHLARMLVAPVFFDLLMRHQRSDLAELRASVVVVLGEWG